MSYKTKYAPFDYCMNYDIIWYAWMDICLVPHTPVTPGKSTQSNMHISNVIWPIVAVLRHTLQLHQHNTYVHSNFIPSPYSEKCRTYTFRFIIKSSLLNFLCRLSTIVQLGKPPVCVDPGTNLKQLSLQNMQTRLKFKQNTWTRLILDQKTWTWLNSLYLYPHKASSIFILPLFVFCPKFELS